MKRALTYFLKKQKKGNLWQMSWAVIASIAFEAGYKAAERKYNK